MKILGLCAALMVCVPVIAQKPSVTAKLTLTQSQESAAKDNGPRSQPYYLRDIARLAGNVGGWWSFLTDNEKGAFLTGYQAAMKQSYSRNMGICKILKDKVSPSSDQKAFDNEVNAALLVCIFANTFDGFEKITTKDLDDFYSDRTNQPIPVEWSMEYLRDKISGRKTNGQLLDALEAEQKDVHDCSKYPSLCKLGVE